MKRRRGHKRQVIATRFLVLALVMALSANTLLAAVSAGADCDRRCCCCTDPVDGRTPSIISGDKIDCCGPAAATACHMTTGSLPVSPPALANVTHHHSADHGQLQVAAGFAASAHPSSGLQPPWVDTGPEHTSLPLFLRTSRLIC